MSSLIAVPYIKPYVAQLRAPITQQVFPDRISGTVYQLKVPSGQALRIISITGTAQASSNAGVRGVSLELDDPKQGTEYLIGSPGTFQASQFLKFAFFPGATSYASQPVFGTTIYTAADIPDLIAPDNYYFQLTLQSSAGGDIFQTDVSVFYQVYTEDALANTPSLPAPLVAPTPLT